MAGIPAGFEEDDFDEDYGAFDYNDHDYEIFAENQPLSNGFLAKEKSSEQS